VDALGRFLARYWGYLAIAIAISGYFIHGLGWAVVLALSLAALGYFLLASPVWCGAITRKGEMCRNNSHGLLRGCSIRQHKWQRLKQTFTPAGGRALVATSKSTSGAITTIGGVVSSLQVIIAAGVLIFR
jgi:hypothetical protein